MDDDVERFLACSSPETAHNGKKRRLAVQTVASLSVSKLWLDGSRLAVMHEGAKDWGEYRQVAYDAA
jgi:hypothetical protein